MKNFLVFDGQHPFSMTDIEFVHKSAVEMFLQLATAMVPPGVNYAVISGCEITEEPGGTSIAPGLVYWNDGTQKRLCLVEGKNLPITLLSNLKLAYTAGPADGLPASVLYKNGVPRQIYLDERLDFVAATDPRPGFLVTQLNYRYMSERPGDILVWHPRPGDTVEKHFDLATGLGKNRFLGYALCDGRNDTPDYRGRVPLGWVPVEDIGEDNVREMAEYRTIGEKLGKRRHALTIEEMPSHNHEADGRNNRLLQVFQPGDSGGPTLQDGDATVGEPNLSTSGAIAAKGGGQAHENRQPSIVAVFYQKL